MNYKIKSFCVNKKFLILKYSFFEKQEKLNILIFKIFIIKNK